MRAIALALIATLSLPVAGLAQTQPPSFIVRPVTGAAPAGVLRASLARHARELAAARSPAAADEARRSWPARHPILLGALVGAGSGTAAAAIACRGACEGNSTPYLLLFGGIGAAVGAGVGALVARAIP